MLCIINQSLTHTRFGGVISSCVKPSGTSPVLLLRFLFWLPEGYSNVKSIIMPNVSLAPLCMMYNDSCVRLFSMKRGVCVCVCVCVSERERGVMIWEEHSDSPMACWENDCVL